VRSARRCRSGDYMARDAECDRHQLVQISLIPNGLSIPPFPRREISREEGGNPVSTIENLAGYVASKAACRAGRVSAVLSAFNPVPGQLRCACGADDLRLCRRADGSALVTCVECRAQAAEIAAGIETSE
jgi:hypothetical protein